MANSDFGCKVKAIFFLIIMVVADWFVWLRLSDALVLAEGNGTTWTLYAVIFLGMLIGTFGLPLLIATGRREMNLMNGLFGTILIMFVTPIVMFITDELWDFANTLLVDTSDTLIPFVAQFLLILIMIAIGFVLPIMVMLSDQSPTEWINNLFGGE